MFRIALSVILAAFLSSCTAKAIPKIDVVGSGGTMSMELTKPSHGMTSLAISGDGSHILTADNGGSSLLNPYAKSTIRLWDISSGKLVRSLPMDTLISNISFSADGRFAALTGRSGMLTRSLKLLEVSSGKILWEESPPGTDMNRMLERATFTPDGKHVVAPGSPAAFYETATGRMTGKLKYDGGFLDTGDYIAQAAFSPDGRYILIGSKWFEEFKLLDARTLKTLRTYKGHTTPATIVPAAFVSKSLSFSPDGKHAMSSIAPDDSVIVWDIETGKELRRYSGFPKINMDFRVVSSSFSPDGRSAFIQGLPLKIWDIASGKGKGTILSVFNVPVTSNPPNGASFNPKGGSVALSYGDSGIRIVDAATGKETAMMVGFEDGEWIVITREGYYNASEKGAEYLSVRMGERKYDTNLFYDVFYRPDIVMATLRGEDISGLVSVTMEDVIKSPPPSMAFVGEIRDTDAQKVQVCYTAKSTGGGIGEVRLFHNGKLIRSDGYYRDVARGTKKVPLTAMDSKAIYAEVRGLIVKEKAQASPIGSARKGEAFKECTEVDVVSGENEISIAAFNADNTVQSNVATSRFTSRRPPEEPHLYILSVGIDRYLEGSINLKYAAKDASDIGKKLIEQASTLFRTQNIHHETIANEEAKKKNFTDRINALAAKIRPSDSFILFVAGHGVLLQNQYFMLTHDYAGGLTDAALISANEIVEMSKKMKSLSQLFIFDTCHAGGMDYIVSGLYDARMSALAKKMGLHIYASASSRQEAMDGYQGNGLFTHALLDGLNNNRKADRNRDGKVSLVELGDYSKSATMALAKKVGHSQTPLIINFGNDSAVYGLKR